MTPELSLDKQDRKEGKEEKVNKLEWRGGVLDEDSCMLKEKKIALIIETAIWLKYKVFVRGIRRFD